MLGNITWHLIPNKRLNMAINNAMQSLSLNHQKATELVKKSWVRFGPMIVEVLRFPIITKNIDKYVHIHGKEYLTEAVNYQRGVIIATAHSDNWELLGAALALNGFNLVGVSQQQSNLSADKFINEYRQMSGMKIMYKYDVRSMFKLLKEGWIIGLIMDQDAAEDGIVMPFLGRNASCAHGAATLARFNNAPIVPVFITAGEKPHTHDIFISPPMFVEKTKHKHHDIRVTTEKITKIIEAHILNHTEEWFWLHNRWKSVERHRATKTYLDKEDDK